MAQVSGLPEKDSTTSVKHFHIFGNGIAFSKSPAIQTAAFRHHNLPHTYDILETTSVDEVASLIDDQSFGGASVTMPHKLAVHKFCDRQTEHARRIGAINTLIVVPGPEKERLIIGENTDWSGLHAIISKKTRSWKERPHSGLVIGAGGASRAALYAMYQSGLRKMSIVNRTVANAEKIAGEFKELFEVGVIQDLQSLTSTPHLVIGTVPADKTTEEDFAALFQNAGAHGLCIDMAYKPRRTPLLTVAERQPGWVTVPGVEVLLHQAFDQFYLWTGLKAPETVMEQSIEISDLPSTVDQGSIKL